MKEYLNFEGLSHFFNKLLSKIESTYAKSSDLTNPISRITQNENDIADLKTQVDQKVPTSRTINGKALTNNITLSASDVSADPAGIAQTKADAALSSAKSYTDTKIADLVDSAPDTLNTLNELAVAIQENEDVVEALNSAVGNKVDKVSGKGLSTNDYTTAEKEKLATVSAGAEANQNAFSSVVVGSTTISADSKTDTLTFAAGTNITLTPDANSDKITIASKDTVYTHPTHTAKTSNLYKITVDGLGHVTDATAVVKSDILALGIPAQDTTYTEATTSKAGLMSASDKTLLGTINDRVGTTSVASQIESAIAGKSDSDHTHDDRYYTETEIDAKLNNKVDKVSGKGLSTNDYTTAEKNKLAGLHTVATTGSWNDIEDKKLTVTDDDNGNVTISL